MYPQRRVVRLARGLGLLVTLLVLALSACGGGGSGQEQANKPRPLPEVEKATEQPNAYGLGFAAGGAALEPTLRSGRCSITVL
jgi:hypothetical protein